MIEYHTGKREYRLIVNLHGTTYRAKFPAAGGKRKALAKAEKYDRELRKLLAPFDVPPFQHCEHVYLEIDTRWDNESICCGYRSDSGAWRRVTKSIESHGIRDAIRLARTEAKQLHCAEAAPAGRQIRLPSAWHVKQALREFE